jgi:hypothetical protein
MDKRVEDGRDDGNHGEPEVDFIGTQGSASGRDPDLRQVDQARNDGKQQADGDEPGGALVTRMTAVRR